MIELMRGAAQPVKSGLAEALPLLEGAEYCTMCGEHWCSIRVNKEIRASVQDDPAAQAS